MPWSHPKGKGEGDHLTSLWPRAWHSRIKQVADKQPFLGRLEQCKPQMGCQSEICLSKQQGSGKHLEKACPKKDDGGSLTKSHLSTRNHGTRARSWTISILTPTTLLFYNKKWKWPLRRISNWLEEIKHSMYKLLGLHLRARNPALMGGDKHNLKCC